MQANEREQTQSSFPAVHCRKRAHNGGWETCPLAYCPPGSICGMLSIPRALPPVTHSSALQAPECLWGIIRGKNRNLQDRGGSLFIALRWMQRPERVMVGLTENIQACLRIFRRAQHQWLVRDILHPSQGVFYVFVLHLAGHNPSNPLNPW